MATRSDAYIQGLLGQIQNNNAMAISRGDFATGPISVDQVAAEMSAMGYAIPDQTKFNPTKRNPVNRNAVDTSASWSRAASQSVPDMSMGQSAPMEPAYSDEFLANVTADYNNWLSTQGQTDAVPSVPGADALPGQDAVMNSTGADALDPNIPVLNDDEARYKQMYEARNAAGPNMVGNVDINHRPILLNPDGSYSTSQTAYQQKWYGDEENGGYRIAHYTPILADGQKMTDEQMQQYIDNVMAMPDPMEADRNALGLLYQVDTEFNGEKITDANLPLAYQYADLWDQNMHIIQDGLYGEEARLKGQLYGYPQETAHSAPQNNPASAYDAIQSAPSENVRRAIPSAPERPQRASFTPQETAEEIPVLAEETPKRRSVFTPDWDSINAVADRAARAFKRRNPKATQREINEARQSAKEDAYLAQRRDYDSASTEDKTRNIVKPGLNTQSRTQLDRVSKLRDQQKTRAVNPFEDLPEQNARAVNPFEDLPVQDVARADKYRESEKGFNNPNHPYADNWALRPAKDRDETKPARANNPFEDADIPTLNVSRDAKYRDAFKARQDNQSAETPWWEQPVEPAANSGVVSDVVKPGINGRNLQQNNMVPVEREAQSTPSIADDLARYRENFQNAPRLTPELPQEEILPVELTDAANTPNTTSERRADLSGIQFEEAHRDRSGDLNSRINRSQTVERYLDPNYRMTGEEQQDAKEISRQWFEEHPAREWLSPSAPEELRQEAGNMLKLAAKTSNYGAYAMGLMDQITKAPQLVNQWLIKSLGSIGMSDEERAAYQADVDEAFRGMNQDFQGMRTQSPIAYGGGTMAGRTMQSMAVDSAADALGVTSRLGNITDRLANTRAGQYVAGAIQNLAGRFGEGVSREAATQAVSNIANSAAANFGEDLINDTLPSAIRNAENGMTAQENALATLQNIGENALIDIGVAGAGPAREFLPSITPSAWGDALRRFGESAGELVPDWARDAARWAGNRLDTSGVDLGRTAMRSADDVADVARSADTAIDAARSADTAVDAARSADTATDAARAATNPFEDAARSADAPRAANPFEDAVPTLEEPARPSVEEVRGSRNVQDYAEAWERPTTPITGNSRSEYGVAADGLTRQFDNTIGKAIEESGNQQAIQQRQTFYDAILRQGNTDVDVAAADLKNTLSLMGIDPSAVDDVTAAWRGYYRLEPLYNAQSRAANPELYSEAISQVKSFEDALTRYQNGELSFEDLQKSVKDAQKAVRNMNNAISKAAKDPDAPQRLADELTAIREEFGIHSTKTNVTVGISKETANALAYKGQSPEDAIEAINGTLNRKGNMSHVRFKIDADNADAYLDLENTRSLIDRVTANRDALYQAKHPGSEFDGLQNELYYEFADAASDDLKLARSAERPWTDQDEEDFMNLYLSPEERAAYLAEKAAQAETPSADVPAVEPELPAAEPEIPRLDDAPRAEAPQTETAAMDTEEIPTLTGEVPEAPRTETRPRKRREQTLEEVREESGLPFVEPTKTAADSDIPRLGETEPQRAPEPEAQRAPEAQTTPEPQSVPEPQTDTGFGGRRVTDAAEAAENDNARKLSRNFNTIQNSETWSEAQKAEVARRKEDWFYDPDVEKNLAAQAETAVKNDISGVYDHYMNGMDGQKMESQDVHNALAAAMAYDQMASDALKNGDAALAQSYRNKSTNMQIAARREGTKAGQYLAAMKYYARTGEGSVAAAEKALLDKADDWAAKNPKAADGIDELAQKLSDYLRSHNAEAIMNGTDEGLKDALRVDINEAVDQFLNEADKQTRKALKGLSQEAMEQILLNRQAEDIARQLDFFASSGGMGVKLQTMDRVMELFDQAQQYGFDSREYVKLEKQAYALLANDLAPKGGTFKDKFDQWRYLAMLANPTTHIKNVTGNTLFGSGMVSVKNTLAATIEEAADRVSKATGNGGITRAKAILTAGDADLVRAAKKDGMDNFYRELTGSGRYTSVSNSIDDAIPTWSTETKSGRFMNWLSDANTKALNAEDELFMFQKYSTSLAGYLKANGLDASALSSTHDAVKSVVQEGRNYALKQAEEAAFHQESKIANNLSQFTKNLRDSDSPAAKALGTLIDVTVPFKKTPVNIVRSIYEYSPLGLTNVVKDISALNKGVKGAVNDLIDDVAKTATGSAAMLLGAALAREGIIKVTSSQEKEATSFDTMTGRQNFSVKVGDKYINVSEFAPAATPFILGATVFDTWANRKDGDAALNTMLNGLSAISDSVTDMTMLSGIADVLKDARYTESDSDIWANMGIGMLGNVASQMLPTVGRKLETTIDDTKRSTYSDRSGLAKKVDQEARYLTTKIPGLQALGERMSESDNETIKQIGDYIGLPAAVDAWGRVKENPGGNAFGRALNNFVNPTTITEDTSDEYDNELRRIFEATENNAVFPYTAQSEGNVNGNRMTPHEFEEYSIAKGQMSHDLVMTLMDHETYGNMSDEDRAETLDALYKFSKAYNQHEYGGNLSKANAVLANLYEEGGSKAVIDYMTAANAINESGLSATDKTRAIYEDQGQEGLDNYATIKSAIGSSPTIAEGLEYINANPDMAEAFITNYGGKWTGTISQNENGEWIYTKTSGTVIRASSNDAPAPEEQRTAPIPTLGATAPAGTVQRTSTAAPAPATQAAEQEIPVLSSDNWRDSVSSVPADYISGINWDVPNSKSYGRYMDYAPQGTVDSYMQMYNAMDADRNRGLKNAEITSYLDNSGLTDEEKYWLFSIYANVQSKNPYPVP